MRIRLLLGSCCLMLTLTIAIILSAVLPALGADDDDMVSALTYPDHDAVILLNRKEHRFQIYIAKETSIRSSLAARTEIRTERRIKILREGGFEKFGDFESSTYNREAHEYKLEVRVITPEGKKKKVKKDNIKKIELTDRYFRYRVAFPGLQVGSIIEIREEIKSEYPILSGIWNLGAEVPTLRSELIFRVPKGTMAKFSSIPEKAIEKPRPEKDGRYDVYEVVRENIPPFPVEIFMSPANYGNPTLYYHVWMISNNALAQLLGIDPQYFRGKPYSMNWDDVVDMLTFYFDPDTWDGDEKSSEYRDAVFEDVSRFRVGFDVTEEKLGELLDWFRSEFEAVDDDLFYYSSNPEESFKLRKGGPFELAYVMKYILDELGASSSVVVVREADKGLINRNMPSPSAFTHPLLRIGDKGNEFWIDPYSHYCRLGQLPWQCRGVEAMTLLKSGEGSFTVISLADAEENCLRNNVTGEIDAEGNLTSEVEVTFSGQHLLNLRQSVDEDDPDAFSEEIRDLLEETYPEAFDEESFEIVENLKNELKLKYSYSIDDFADVADDYMHLDFSSWLAISLAVIFESNERTFDLEFPFLQMEHTKVTLKLPEGAVIEELPPMARIENQFITYKRTFQAENGVVAFERKMKVLEPTINIEDYQAAKSSVGEMYGFDKDQLIVRK